MEERDTELPVATARPRRLLGRLSAARGALGRWLRQRVLAHLRGREGVFLLTGIFFSGMLLCMGYVAERANRAADAIDEAQRAQRAEQLLGDVVQAAQSTDDEDEHEHEDEHEATAAPAPGGRDHVLFYIVGGER